MHILFQPLGHLRFSRFGTISGQVVHRGQQLAVLMVGMPPSSCDVFVTEELLTDGNFVRVCNSRANRVSQNEL